jgi:hypothetical protein
MMSSLPVVEAFQEEHPECFKASLAGLLGLCARNPHPQGQ